MKKFHFILNGEQGLIETLWNVNALSGAVLPLLLLGLIETLWNVNVIGAVSAVASSWV